MSELKEKPLILPKLLTRFELGERKIVFKFKSIRAADLFRNSLSNERRKNKEGKSLKISVDKIYNQVIVTKKIEPKLELFKE